MVDLCRLVDALLASVVGSDIDRTGHELLISLANENEVAHVSRYNQEKPKDEEARVVYAYLQRHPEEVPEFVHAIPPAEEMEKGD